MLTLNARVLVDSDYDDILVGWWNDWGWTPPLKDFLPDDGKGGIIVYDGDIPVCAGFVYFTNSKAAWVDWIVSNKQYRVKPTRRQALSLLIDSLTLTCKNMGCSYIYALIKNGSLKEVYESFGYVKGDTYTSEMIKKI